MEQLSSVLQYKARS